MYIPVPSLYNNPVLVALLQPHNEPVQVASVAENIFLVLCISIGLISWIGLRKAKGNNKNNT